MFYISPTEQRFTTGVCTVACSTSSMQVTPQWQGYTSAQGANDWYIEKAVTYHAIIPYLFSVHSERDTSVLYTSCFNKLGCHRASAPTTQPQHNAADLSSRFEQPVAQTTASSTKQTCWAPLTSHQLTLPGQAAAPRKHPTQPQPELTCTPLLSHHATPSSSTKLPADSGAVSQVIQLCANTHHSSKDHSR